VHLIGVEKYDAASFAAGNNKSGNITDDGKVHVFKN
jgi:hypothetical protein